MLVVGSGAREHALAWKLSQSSRAGEIFVAPGNAGTATVATNVPVAVGDFDGLLKLIEDHDIGLTVVGPEDPLANGLADHLLAHGHPVFGPVAAGARIESSKSWAKEIMTARNVPTGAAATFDSLDAALDFIYDADLPLVIKADGLAAGKGVVICTSREEAEETLRSMMDARSFGSAGETVLIEEFLTGMEVSLLVLTDGTTTIPLLPACDYKPVGDGDTGLNTGGMGAYTRPALADEAFIQRVMSEIVHPVLAEMAGRGVTYRGVLYAGLIATSDGPKVIEFNCRFGDPEIQVILPLLESDLLEICQAVASGTLGDLPPLQWSPKESVGVVVASGGYPGSYRSGDVIEGLDDLPEGGLVFHAGTRLEGDRIVTAGGRVLTAVGRGATRKEAADLAYRTAAAVRFADAFYRRDIAAREISD